MTRPCCTRFIQQVPVMVKVFDGPGQPAAVGVTVIVPDIGVEPALVAVNDGMLPEPLAAKPIAVLLFVQV